MELLCGEVGDLAGRAGEFDRVLAVNVFMFWPDPVALLREVAALMAPGARIALTMQPRGPGVTNEDTRLAGERMATALREAGMQDVKVHTLTLRPVDAACAIGRIEPIE